LLRTQHATIAPSFEQLDSDNRSAPLALISAIEILPFAL
jgi:hypothetical protein